MNGVPDYLSIATDGWEDSNGAIPDSISIATLGWAESSETIESYQEYSAMPNEFFQEEDAEYDVESNLFDLLATESINMHGVPMVYYITSFNTSYDKVFGEDNNRNITRKFNVMAHFELPNEDLVYSTWGIEGVDNFHMEISMRHMETASQYNSDQTAMVYPSYTPKQGDIMIANYNSTKYEIIQVKQQVGQFLKRQHIWDIICKPLRDENLSVSGSISSNDDIRNVESILDIFDTSASIEIEKPDKLYDNSGDQQPDGLFGSWQ